jgi:polysaccharide export outer membrane protein
LLLATATFASAQATASQPPNGRSEGGAPPATTAPAGQQPAGRQPAPPATAQPPATRPPQPAAPPPSPAAAPQVIPQGVAVPVDYTIGADDVLNVVFWRDKEMSSEVTVRPDGKISLPLLNDIQAIGLSPAQLGQKLEEEAKRYIEDPNVTVVVKTINSRKVSITGEVAKPGTYPLTSPTTVLQLIAMAGGLGEYADSKNIVIIRNENGKQIGYPFNYKTIKSRKGLAQNIELKPGDTVVVP